MLFCLCCLFFAFARFIKFILNCTVSELYTFMAFKRDMFHWLACYCIDGMSLVEFNFFRVRCCCCNFFSTSLSLSFTGSFGI